MRSRGAATGLLASLLAACGGTGPSPRDGPRDGARDEAIERARAEARLVAEPWPEAEALFRRDARWLGGDAVWSIDLGGERTLWLFGDSFVATSPARSRRESRMVRNSIAIQTGRDVATATMSFRWRDKDGGPDSFFEAPGERSWYWPGHGARTGSRVVLFLWEIAAVPRGLGFEGVGWTAIAIDNPDEPPESWTLTKLACASRFPLLLGSAVAVDGGKLHAFGCGLAKPEPNVLARWPIDGVELAAPEWLDAGLETTLDAKPYWRAESGLEAAPAALAVGQSEFGLARDARAGWLLVQTVGFGGATLAYRTADALAGPWSDPTTFFEPPDRDRSGLLVYAAKLHPTMRAPGFDVVASYSTNCLDFATLLDDLTLYFPRFLRARWE